MSVDFLIVSARHAVLIASLGWVVAFCAGASARQGEGAAGAGVRIIATLVVPATALALLGVLYWPFVLGVSAASAWWQGVGSLGFLTDRLRAVWGALSSVSKVAIATVAVAACLRAGAALSTPPTDGDGLLYHLPMIAAMIQDHSMWFTRALLYPAAGEIGEAAGGALVGNINGVVAFQVAEILALALIAFGWARRAGAREDGAAAAAVVACALPIVIDQMFTSQNDIFVCTMLAAGCVLWRAWPRLAAVAFGLVFAAKLTGFVLVPAVAMVMIALEGWPFSWTDIVCAFSIAAPWYLRTWILTGSPIYTVSSLGWSSTIAANLPRASAFMILALRIYGGLTAMGGVLALAFGAVLRGRNAFTRALPWLSLAGLIAWLVLPNSAESVTGTLDQIRQGWSLRYALLLPFVLATALPIVLDRVTRAPLAAFVALIAAASAVVRSANLTGSDEPFGFAYAVPLVIALICAVAALLISGARDSVGGGTTTAQTGALFVALVLWSATATLGSRSIERHWDASYLQWNVLIPTTSVLLDERVRASSKIAVIGMRSFPLVGPSFRRRTYDDVVVQSPKAWLAMLRRDGVGLMAAAGESGSPDQPGFLRPLPVEAWFSNAAGVCKLATHAYVRVYGLDPKSCAPER